MFLIWTSLKFCHLVKSKKLVIELTRSDCLLFTLCITLKFIFATCTNALADRTVTDFCIHDIFHTFEWHDVNFKASFIFCH